MKQNTEKKQSNSKLQTTSSPALVQFRHSLNGWSWITAIGALLVADLGIWFTMFFIEINLSKANWLVTALDFVISFRIIPSLAMFAVYGITAYAIAKLGVRRAKLQICLLLVYSVLSLFAQTIEEMATYLVLYPGNETLLATISAYLAYTFPQVGYWILNVVLVLIPPLVLIWLCVVFSDDYRARLASGTLKAKNPMPQICFWSVLTQSILRLFSIVPQSITEYRSIGFFQNFYEAFTFFFPYIELILFGIGGYWIMRGIAAAFRRKIVAIKQQIPIPEIADEV